MFCGWAIMRNFMSDWVDTPIFHFSIPFVPTRGHHHGVCCTHGAVLLGGVSWEQVSVTQTGFIYLLRNWLLHSRTIRMKIRGITNMDYRKSALWNYSMQIHRYTLGVESSFGDTTILAGLAQASLQRITKFFLGGFFFKPVWRGF